MELRKYLNSAIRGKNTDAVLEALETGNQHLIQSIQAINDSLYIVKAENQYLDSLLAGRDFTRPENVGLSDELFRSLGIEVTNRKQIRDLINSILNIMFGDEFTKATLKNLNNSPYQLENNDNLILSFDGQESIEIFFKSTDFTNINSATAQEVADAITKQLRFLNKVGVAFQTESNNSNYVTIMSPTIGASSSVQILGGAAQNKLRFPNIRPTSAQPTTQWEISNQGGVTRLEHTGGATPSLGKVRIGDYINMYGVNFNPENRGTFTVVSKSETYVEYINPNSSPQVTTQGASDSLLFFSPYKAKITDKSNYAALYQTQANLLEIFIPATTKVVRRDRIGSAHIHDSLPSQESYGPHVFDISKPYNISEATCNTTQIVDANSNIVINVDNASNIPESQGFVVFGWGTSKEEGPVPYITRPSNNTLMINPTYKFKYKHSVGTSITYINFNNVYNQESDGTDYGFYITDIVSGRAYTEELINLVAATGIKLVITILYPNDIGWAKWGTSYSSKYQIFGPDRS